MKLTIEMEDSKFASLLSRIFKFRLEETEIVQPIKDDVEYDDDDDRPLRESLSGNLREYTDPEPPPTPEIDQSLVKNCIMCRKPFIPTKDDQETCSEECEKKVKELRKGWSGGYKREDRKKKKVETEKPVAKKETAKCKVCDKEFQKKRRNQVYCSTECRIKYSNAERDRLKDAAKAAKKEKQAICPLCDLPFTRRDASQKFCQRCEDAFGDRKCEEMLQEKHKKNKEQNEKEIAEKKKVCPRCGKIFEAADKNMFYCEKCTARALGAKKIEPLKKED